MRSDAKIVVTFSKPMDQAVTEATYQSADLPSSGVTFSWDASGAVLTVKPNAPLVYARGTTIGTEAKVYAFKLTGVAKDASGSVAVPLTSSFKTLRDITATLKSEAERDGSVRKDGINIPSGLYITVGEAKLSNLPFGYRGFLSFDLSSIPSGLPGSSFLGATLSIYKNGIIGSPYSALNPCQPSSTTNCGVVNLDHVAYGPSLDVAAYSTPVFAALGPIDSVDVPVSTYAEADVTDALIDDLTNRGIRENRSQYRLSFPLETSSSSGAYNSVTYFSGENGTNPPLLVINYLIP